MNEYSNLHRRIDKMLAAIEPLLPVAQSSEPLFKLHLFAPQEQSRLQSFLLLHNITRNRFQASMSELGNAEMDELGNWLRLEQALDSEDTIAAERYRRYLATSQEQLLAMFLALDENSIPRQEGEHIPTYEDKHVTYTLHRTNFRHTRQTIERHLKSGSLQPGDIDDMWMWVETYSQGPGRGPIVA